MRSHSGFGSPLPESGAKESNGMAACVRIDLMAADKRLFGCNVLIGRAGGKASSTAGAGLDCSVGALFNSRGGVPTMGAVGEEFISPSPLLRRETESILPPKAEDVSDTSESSSSSSSSSNKALGCLDIPTLGFVWLCSTLLALAAFRAASFCLWYAAASTSFSDDISLLVAVPLLARSLTTSSCDCDPLLAGAVRIGEMVDDCLRLELRIGDEPERFRIGILENLICCAAR